MVTLNERVETAANIRDWLKEESEWRDDSTLVGFRVFAPHLTPPLQSRTGQVLDMAITPLKASLTRHYLVYPATTVQ